MFLGNINGIVQEFLPGLLYGSDHLKNSKEHMQKRNKKW